MIDKVKHFADVNLPQLYGISLLVEDMVVQQDLSLSSADRTSLEELERVCSRLVAGLQQMTGRSSESASAMLIDTIPAVPKSSVSLFHVSFRFTG